MVDWFNEHPQLTGSGDRFTVRVESTERLRADYIFDQGGAEIVLRVPHQSVDADAALLALVRRFAKDAMLCRLAYHAKCLDLEFPNSACVIKRVAGARAHRVAEFH